MVTKAVSMDIKMGGSNRSRPQDGNDGGFSDVLGSVGKDGKSGKGSKSGVGMGSESSRSGSADMSGVQRGREFGKEFRFAEKAANRAPGDDSGGQPGTQGSSFDKGQPAEAQAADEILSEAAELVMETIRETGEKPDKAEAAEMLAQALKTLKSGEDAEEVPEDALIDALMQIFTAIAEDGGVYGAAEVVDEDAVMAVTDGFAENIAQTVMPETEPGVQTDVQLTDDGREFASTLGEQTAVFEEIVPDDDGLKQFVGESVQKLAEGRLSIEAAAAGFETEAEVQTQTAIPDNLSELSVDETVKLLADLLDEAKKELGLSEIRVEHVYGGEEEEAVPMMRDESVQLSHKMFGKDSTGELDHILSGTRFDVSEDDDTTDTETYDAVRMSSELMGSRTDTDIPVENEQMFPERMEISPPEVQTAEQILDRIQHMQDDHTEFTMVLNPESLGRITVRIAAAGERMSVEITADDPRTGAMLAARSEGLQNMLRDSGVQLEKCQIVSEHEDTQFNEQSYDGSSKNPYGREDDDGKQSDDDGDGESFYDLLQSI